MEEERKQLAIVLWKALFTSNPEEYVEVYDEDNIEDVGLDGDFNLLRLAECLIAKGVTFHGR